ncbi:hypothetical protein QUF72_11310 [Desulfobacterales bacterium HSG2]|nr:hypothetical protein [Desulfobacterales bacterium HSG2]
MKTKVFIVFLAVMVMASFVFADIGDVITALKVVSDADTQGVITIDDDVTGDDKVGLADAIRHLQETAKPIVKTLTHEYPVITITGYFGTEPGRLVLIGPGESQSEFEATVTSWTSSEIVAITPDVLIGDYSLAIEIGERTPKDIDRPCSVEKVYVDIGGYVRYAHHLSPLTRGVWGRTKLTN